MAEEKESSSSVPLSQADPEDPAKAPLTSSNSSTRELHTNVYLLPGLLLCPSNVVLFPVAVTFFVTWWFIQFVDGFFSPLYERLGIDIFGLGFITSLVFVFLVGVFVSSWIGGTVFWLGEWLIKRMPFPPNKLARQFLQFVHFPLPSAAGKFRHYAAFSHVAVVLCLLESYVDPKYLLSSETDQNTTAFKEVAIIRHPRIGEYAFGFITSSLTLQRDDGDEELCSVFVPTNHLYIGDIFLVNSKDIIRPNLSIREGIEIIVSGGMTMPQVISPVESITRPSDRVPLNRMS
ncbi:hypothetical protein Cgig2_019984 [Carnegiea gigantea]|uniref:Protein LIKE COV 2 n=1 Tax=Carnegiea gigantea TaxID=171969 RepID=A0A9Q1QHW2_9CARY|nr:hypothetical protein Cgig2_019984 [Carnegiea gigantea]